MKALMMEPQHGRYGWEERMRARGGERMKSIITLQMGNRSDDSNNPPATQERVCMINIDECMNESFDIQQYNRAKVDSFFCLDLDGAITGTLTCCRIDTTMPRGD